MVDITTMTWYDSNKNPYENYDTAEQWYSDNYPDINTMTQEESTCMVECYAKLRVMMRQWEEKKAIFEAAKYADSEVFGMTRAVHEVKWANADGQYNIPQ